jgi:arylsulfatase A-like enzyme
MARDQTPHAHERLLFEALRARGIHTALLSNVTIFFVRGLSQGAQTRSFKTSHVTKHGATPGAAHMSGELLRHIDLWREHKLKPHRERLALWGHIYDPHEPYFELKDHPQASDQERYLGAVRGVDDALNTLFKGLEKRGLLSETMILLTADHGDEFGEHGGRFHGRTLYEEMVRVPLWLYHPHLPPQRITAPFSHLHVAPTLLDLLGLPAEPRFEGESWAARLSEREELKARPSDLAFFEVLPDRNYHEHLVGVSAERWKLIYDLNHNAFELYDLKVDPHEQCDISHLLNATSTVNAQTLSSAERDRLSLLKRALLSYAEEHIAALSKGQAGVSKPWGSP